jgi:hypothetical protein
VASLAPKIPDTGCDAGTQIALAQIVGVTGLPSERVMESLKFLRTWRVLWVRFRGEMIEVRFQRSVVMWLLGAARVAPKEIGKLIAAHRRRREAIAPLPGAANSAGNVLSAHV